MPRRKTLVEQVTKKLASADKKQSSGKRRLPEFSREARAALRLADAYVVTEPQEYVLPLDEMAGFWSTETQTENSA